MNQVAKLQLLALTLYFSVLALLPKAYAQEEDIFAIPKTYAVQNRKYTLNNQLTAHFGYMPMDSFTKGVVFGASYTKYFSDFTGWEVLNANYVMDITTGLKDDLLKNFQADPGLIPDFPEWYVTTNLVYTPVYTKNLFFNSDVVWGDLSFVGGGGVASYQRDGVKPLVDIGLMLRFFYSEKSSIKLDIRENLPFLSSGVEPFLTINIAYSYQIGGNKNGKKNELEKQFE